jgi:hypothetical protein
LTGLTTLTVFAAAFAGTRARAVVAAFERAAFERAVRVAVTALPVLAAADVRLEPRPVPGRPLAPVVRVGFTIRDRPFPSAPAARSATARQGAGL